MPDEFLLTILSPFGPVILTPGSRTERNLYEADPSRPEVAISG